MTWDAMIAWEQRANNPVEGHHEWWTKAGGHGTGRWSQKAFLAGVTWVLERQGAWDNLTEREAILELRKGPESIYHPLFADDAKVRVDCPRDGITTVGVEGVCDHCLYDFLRTP